MEHLDTSWIHSSNISSSGSLNSKLFSYEREPIPSIALYFIYTDNDLNIQNITTTEHAFSTPSSTTFKKEQIMYYIENRRKIDNKKYKLVDLLCFHVDLEEKIISDFIAIKEENIQSFSQSFFKVLNIFHDITFSSSIFHFHSLSSLYFIFRENQPEPEKPTLKSILKVPKKYKKTRKIKIMGNIGGNVIDNFINGNVEANVDTKPTKEEPPVHKMRKTKKVRIIAPYDNDNTETTN